MSFTRNALPAVVAGVVFLASGAPFRPALANPTPLVIDGDYGGTAVSNRRGHRPDDGPFWTLQLHIENPNRHRLVAELTATRSQTGEVIGPVTLKGSYFRRPRTVVFHLAGKWNRKQVRFRGEFGTDTSNLPGSGPGGDAPPPTMKVLSGIYRFAGVPDKGSFTATAPLD